MLIRFLAGVGLLLAITATTVTAGASQAGGRRQAASNTSRIDTVGTHKGRLALTDSGLVFRPCGSGVPYVLEYAGGTRAMVYERVRWLMRRPRDELYAVFRGKLVTRGAKQANKGGNGRAEATRAASSRSRVELLVNRVDSLRVLRVNECAAPRPRG